MDRNTAGREEEEKKVELILYNDGGAVFSLLDEEPLDWSLVLWGLVAVTSEDMGHLCR